MDLHLAAIIAHDTREQAVHDARTDLHRLQQQVIEAGRDESRRLIKVSHINHATGQATYRPAGRLLRDWYLHCFTNALRDRLGSPAVTIDAQQIEDTTALLHRLTPNQTGIAALRAVAVLRDVADADAAHATVTIATSLHASAARRAIAHAPDGRFDADPLRIHVTRHWYLHSYLDQLHTATHSHPIHIDTGAAERQVALTLTSRTVHSLANASVISKTYFDGHRSGPDLVSTDAPHAPPSLSIAQGSAEEVARLMFDHPAQLHSGDRETQDVGITSLRAPGPNEPVSDTASMGPAPPRIA